MEYAFETTKHKIAATTPVPIPMYMYFSPGNNFSTLDSLLPYRVFFDFFHGYQPSRNVSWQALLTVRHKSQTWMTWNEFFFIATKDN